MMAKSSTYIQSASLLRALKPFSYELVGESEKRHAVLHPLHLPEYTWEPHGAPFHRNGRRERNHTVVEAEPCPICGDDTPGENCDCGIYATLLFPNVADLVYKPGYVVALVDLYDSAVITPDGVVRAKAMAIEGFVGYLAQDWKEIYDQDKPSQSYTVKYDREITEYLVMPYSERRRYGILNYVMSEVMAMDAVKGYLDNLNYRYDGIRPELKAVLDAVTACNAEHKQG